MNGKIRKIESRREYIPDDAGHIDKKSVIVCNLYLEVNPENEQIHVGDCKITQ